jgi:soluble lytic murein transglycosylase
MGEVMVRRSVGPLRAVFVVMLAAVLSMAALANAQADALPSPPRAKPPVPDHLPGLSRGLSKPEKALQRAIDQVLSGKSNPNSQATPAGADPLGAAILEWVRLTHRDNRTAFVRAATFMEQHPDWPGYKRLRRAAERTMPLAAAPDFTDAARLDWFRTHPPASATGAMAMASSLLATGETTGARALLVDTWREHDFRLEDEKVFLKHFSGYISREDHIARLDRLLYDRQSAAAKRQAQRLGAGYPELARARLALAYRRSGVDWAIGQVPAALENDVGLLYERIRWRRSKRRLDGVLELLESEAAARIDPERLWPIRAWVVRKLAGADDLAKAYEIACRHGLTQGIGFVEAQWLSGWYALRALGKPKEAMAHFHGLYASATSPISRARGAYWAAQAAHASGDQVLATQWLQRAKAHGTAFYGQRAAEELGEQGPLLPERMSITDTQRRVFLRSELARATALLHRLEFDDLVESFIKHMARTAETADQLRLIADLANRLGRLDLTLVTAKIARRKGHILQDELYPVLDLGPKQAGIEPALVFAVIRQESAFDPGAISRAGARGLMQLMPATAKTVARRIGERYVRDWLTDDPDYNVKLGRAYLRSLVKRFRGSYILALAAYNAGPHRVDRWLREYGDPRGDEISLIDWIEHIPFSETRNYVQRVLEGLIVYRSGNATQLSWKMSPPDGSS